MSLQDRIDRLEDQILVYETRLNTMTEFYMRDTHINPAEERALERVQALIRPLAARLDRLYERLDEENLERGVVNVRDDEALVIEVDTDQYGEAKPFTDDYFKSRFSESVLGWTRDGAISLNSVSSYMNRHESPAGLSISSLLPIMGLIFPASVLVTRVVTLAPIIIAAFEQGVRAARGSTPSLNEIHSAWVGSLASVRDQATLDAKFLQFIAHWKAEQGVERGVTDTWTGLFGPACRTFAADYMPTSNAIQRAFMDVVIQTTEDSSALTGGDWDSSAGDAELEILELVQNWSSPEGQLDDVPEAMLGTIKTVFARAKVIDLPVEINIIVRNVNSANMCEIQRRSRTPGNTEFSRVSGDQAKYDDFMSQRIYNRFYVRNLSLD